jgi:hypothetical protein
MNTVTKIIVPPAPEVGHRIESGPGQPRVVARVTRVMTYDTGFWSAIAELVDASACVVTVDRGAWDLGLWRPEASS